MGWFSDEKADLGNRTTDATVGEVDRAKRRLVEGAKTVGKFVGVAVLSTAAGRVGLEAVKRGWKWSRS